MAELADWTELRDAGGAIKGATMAALDEHLLRLEREVTAAGGVVHWASDANEANEIVTRLVRETGHREVVKVKSMATQEIGLNAALARAGIDAYETDLAEYLGANFAVAETGTLCVVESEGNGRMCLTLPDTDHGDGHREGDSIVARPRGVPAATSPVVDG